MMAFNRFQEKELLNKKFSFHKKAPKFRGFFYAMNLSYWEIKTWLTNVDFTVIGSGIVGLNCALQLKNRFPKSKVLVLEKGILPQGASTKNAGFACFGSPSEILDDLQHHTEDEVLNLVLRRVDGLQLLRNTLGDNNIGYKSFGGYELYLNKDKAMYDYCSENIKRINKLLYTVLKTMYFQYGRIVLDLETLRIN